MRNRAWKNWWSTFPEMRNRRWYAAQFGARIYVMAIDSDTSLLPGSDQDRWIRQQLNSLPSTVDFLLITMHHPPVADIQTHITVDHNPRPNEMAFRDLLSELAPKMHARILISAGHIHNYERNIVNDVTYLVAPDKWRRAAPTSSSAPGRSIPEHPLLPELSLRETCGRCCLIACTPRWSA